MSKIRSTTWTIEPHTEAKLAILKKYLDAWMPIMTSFSGRVIYIDGFAGPGEYVGGISGSPLVAIRSFMPYKNKTRSEVVMTFIEADTKRYNNLESKIAGFPRFPNLKIETINGVFADILKGRLDEIENQKLKLAPTFVFIDPFGFKGIPLNLIKKIMENDRCEVLINFMYEEINRFVSDKKLWPHLEETFGTDEWKAIIDIRNPKQRLAAFHDLYKTQLESVARISYVRSFKMINKRNRTDYFLFFGTNNLTGLKKMKEAMWHVDKAGNFEFSDATFNPMQATLFGKEPDYVLLKKLILDKFKNRTITISELERYILESTPFRETHFKRHILRPLEATDPPKLIRKCRNCKLDESCRTRKAFFKDDCIVELL